MSAGKYLCRHGKMLCRHGKMLLKNLEESYVRRVTLEKTYSTRKVTFFKTQSNFFPKIGNFFPVTLIDLSKGDE